MFLKKVNIELPYDPVIPFLGIYPEQILIKKDIHTHPYVHSIFTIAKTWKQPNVH